MMGCKTCNNAIWLGDAFKCLRGNGNCSYTRKTPDILNTNLRKLSQSYLVVRVSDGHIIQGFMVREDAEAFQNAFTVSTYITTVPMDIGKK